MDDINNLINMCSNIVDDVTDSVVKGDFSNLASDIRHQTDNFLGGGRHGGYAGQPDDGIYRPQTGRNSEDHKSIFDDASHINFTQSSARNTYSYNDASQENVSGGAWTYSSAGYSGSGAGIREGFGQNYSTHVMRTEGKDLYRSVRRNRRVTPFTIMRPGSAGGTAVSTLGWIGTLIFVPSIIGCFFPVNIGGIIACGIFAGISVFAARKGMISRKLVKRFYRYAGIVGRREYADIHELAQQTSESDDQVIKNLNAMIDKNMLPPSAVYDDQHTTLLLTDNAKNQYQAAKKARETREREAADAQAQAHQPQSENQKILKEGRAFINEITDAQINITDVGMKQKLDRLEKVVDRIFDQVEDHPETASDMRKFMNYYIPTTEKLINAYENLDRQPDGENIAKTKKEIEDAVDALTSAYEQMFDRMFENVAWDISSDISVMKSMLAQDGLSESSSAADSAEGPKLEL